VWGLRRVGILGIDSDQLQIRLVLEGQDCVMASETDLSPAELGARTRLLLDLRDGVFEPGPRVAR
jgi:hypothetical protein